MQGVEPDRNQSLLPGMAEHDDVGEDASPNSVSASALASMARTFPAPITVSIALSRRLTARSASRWRTMSPVGISARLMTARMPGR
jgi:hypothetical protein